MTAREDIVRRLFASWIEDDPGMLAEAFASDAVYIESWGPEYRDLDRIRHWFDEWHTRGKVLSWDIAQFLHDGNQTAVEWRFECQMHGEAPAAFEGMTLICWNSEDKIEFLKEFKCEINRYDPYAP